MNGPEPWYLNPVLLTPVVGLLGVFVGGVITAGSTFVLEIRREYREEAREERERLREFKTAGRLIDEELSHANAACNVAVKSATWWLPPALVNSAMWQQHRATLAADLTDADWSSFRVAAVAIDRLIQLRADAIQEGKEKPDVAHIRMIKEQIQPAIKKAQTTSQALGFFSSGGSSPKIITTEASAA